MDKHVVGHIGYSPDFKSTDKNKLIYDRVLKAKPVTKPESDVASIDLVTPDDLDVRDLLQRIKRMQELIRRNRDYMDFTGYEDIRDKILEV